MSPKKPVDPKAKGDGPAPEAKPPVVETVVPLSGTTPSTATPRDPALEIEIAMAMFRGTTLADDGEWVHRDYHVDLPQRHVDMPAWPHTDELYKQHVDTTIPHWDSSGVGPGPKPAQPKKDGPHTDITRGHFDVPPSHYDRNVGDHMDFLGSPHWDYMAPPTTYHVDEFVGHQDEGKKDPDPEPLPDPGHLG